MLLLFFCFRKKKGYAILIGFEDRPELHGDSERLAEDVDETRDVL